MTFLRVTGVSSLDNPIITRVVNLLPPLYKPFVIAVIRSIPDSKLHEYLADIKECFDILRSTKRGKEILKKYDNILQ